MKDFDIKTFAHINTWGEIITSVAWSIIASHHTTFDSTPTHLVFGRDILYNLTSVIDWRVIRNRGGKQVDLDYTR